MGCGASSAAPPAAAADGGPAATIAPPSHQQAPPLPHGCGMFEWRRRAPTCVGRIQSALDSIAQSNGELNACIEVLSEDALRLAGEADARLAAGAAPRALEGMPLLVKTNIDLAGSLSTGGTAGLAEWRPASDAPIAG